MIEKGAFWPPFLEAKVEENCPICSYIEQEKKVLAILSMNENGNIQKIMKKLDTISSSLQPIYCTSTIKKRPNISKKHKKTGRNAPCPCISGIKYKRCCGRPQ